MHLCSIFPGDKFQSATVEVGRSMSRVMFQDLGPIASATVLWPLSVSEGRPRRQYRTTIVELISGAWHIRTQS